MKKLLTVLIFISLLTSCKKEAEDQKDSSVIDHYYVFKDDYSYGYEQKQNQDGSENPLAMFKYGGQKNGVYQLFQIAESNKIINVVECKKPCEFITRRTYRNSDWEDALISKEHFRFTKKTVAEVAMLDAINGKLEQYHVIRNGKNYSLWFGSKPEYVLNKE